MVRTTTIQIFSRTYFSPLHPNLDILLLVGILIVYPDPLQDRSTGSDTSHQQTRKIIQKCMTDLNLTEIWRDLNPNKNDYSCFSNTYDVP